VARRKKKHGIYGEWGWRGVAQLRHAAVWLRRTTIMMTLTHCFLPFSVHPSHDARAISLQRCTGYSVSVSKSCLQSLSVRRQALLHFVAERPIAGTRDGRPQWRPRARACVPASALSVAVRICRAAVLDPRSTPLEYGHGARSKTHLQALRIWLGGLRHTHGHDMELLYII
jgi:hypothetical protein